MNRRLWANQLWFYLSRCAGGTPTLCTSACDTGSPEDPDPSFVPLTVSQNFTRHPISDRVHSARDEISYNCGILCLKIKVTLSVSDFCETFLAALLIYCYFGTHCSFCLGGYFKMGKEPKLVLYILRHTFASIMNFNLYFGQIILTVAIKSVI